MREKMNKKQAAEFLVSAEQRLDQRFARLLREPEINRVVRQPARGQEDSPVKFVRTRMRVAARCS